ncbi:lipid-binding SYLF domain-containing protein [Roseomonas sp. GC11]|uniref:lipid-binding SYLF domain-containing protein n=1 Tax=Roseomonas sp. GC11 TaxID=2950546 RepID=UPI00210EDF08|nr:lipid-binding SYLF domain-containing protein [Roseomonas sp. GC11]MCQ4160746.1 lipid-binding SYLF domain-containing protein [Roseomonas sp. GC11]
MRRSIYAPIALALTALIGLARPAAAAGEEQALVDRSTLAVQEMLGGGNGNAAHFNDAITLLRRARAVMVCPRIFRAGFILGGQGGSCVLLARDGAGSWSSPAFYGLGSGSIGFQIGVQDAMVMMLVLTDKGLNALMDSQFKVGADAGIAVATIGGGISGSTTAAVGADIVTFAKSRGLYAGIALDGSLLSTRSEANRTYYGKDLSPRQIVVDMAGYNPGSDPLRGALLRFGGQHGGGSAPAPAGQQIPPTTPGYEPPPAYQSGGVQAQPLR